MPIAIKQIDATQLADFVNKTISGASFSGSIADYASRSGFYGNTVVYTTGGAQTIQTDITFTQSPTVPYSGTTGEAVSRKYVDDKVTGSIASYSGFASGAYVRAGFTNTFTDINTFTSNIFIPFATNTGHGVNLQNLLNTSGVLQSGIDNIQIFGTIYDYGEQLITGKKKFAAGATVSAPTEPSGIVNLNYLTGNFSITNTVTTTGDQAIAGTKNFSKSPIVPIGVSSNNAVQKAQLDAAINLLSAASGTGNFVGVASVNNYSGVVLIDGAGGISVVSCSGVIYVSGNAQNTSLYSVSIPLTAGATGISFTYNSPFSVEPNVVGSLKYSGVSALSFLNNVVYNSNVSGFNVAFSTGIPSVGYFYNFNAIPVSGGSGFLGLQGERGYAGRNFNPRGAWRAGVQYNPYDVVFTPNNNVTYFTTGTYISDSLNGPSGTGTIVWSLLSSGIVGPTGFSRFQGSWSSGYNYVYGDSVTYNNSTYGLTGSTSSGSRPDLLTGWTVMASSATIGYFINSGVMTGNFTNLSFFLSPATTTGLDLAESFVTRNFFFTGFALGAVISGSGPSNGGILTGRIYQRDTGNNKIILNTFTFNSGAVYARSGVFSYPITGDNRLGIDLLNSLSGIDKFSVGVYGFGT